MRTFNWFCFCLLGLSICVCGGYAQDDLEGSRDHPMFTRMPNYFIKDYDQKDYEAYDFTVATDPDEKKVHEEGKRTMIDYWIMDGSNAAGTLQIIRNYERAIKKIGGKVVWSNNETISTLELKRDTSDIWVEVKGWNWGKECILTILEKQELREDVTAHDMLETLNTEGHVPLYILFDVDKADIKAESQPIIDQVVSLLKENPTLTVRLEGHTDSSGNAQHNQILSEKRAKAVLTSLVGAGIDKSRLQAVGFGQTKPIADNSTEDGRARNRRVELVKK